MALKKIAIIGAGGFARETLDLIDAINQDKQTYDMLGYIVDRQYGQPGMLINDKPILGDFDWLKKNGTTLSVVCGVGAPHQRYHLVKRAKNLGINFESLVHPNVIKTKWMQIGSGVIITAGCILTNQIHLGDHVHINLNCTIGHDTVLKEFVTLAPGVHVSGNVFISEGCYLGTGTNIIEKINIGQWSIIGAGSTIIRDIPPNTTVVGNPGKIIKEREPEWYQEEKTT